jgi:hypothetical protein
MDKLQARLSLQGRSGKTWHFLLGDMSSVLALAEDGFEVEFVKVLPPPKEYRLVEIGTPPQGVRRNA